MSRRFQIVDVFNEHPLSGNPLAVVFDADGMSTDTMQTVTRWLNLSETAFLLSPTDPRADYRVRIFTHDREMPFAGHPTLGSCHAWLESGAEPRNAAEIIQQCGAGLVPIKRKGATLSFAAPPLVRGGPVDEGMLNDIAQFLRMDRRDIVDAQWADNGPGWLVVLLESADKVLALEPAQSHTGRLDLGVVGPYPAGTPLAFELRAFFTDHYNNIREDPVTGSLNASAAQWLLASNRAHAPYTASQGTRIGHGGRIYIDRGENDTVWVGGKTSTLFSGTCGI
ncbi:MAG TPA: PhzF family phenazine biosynthesis protein [Burkholderiaceae bacterium]